MGKVSEYVTQLIEKQVAERGIVIWYDPEGAYAKLVDRLALPEVMILRYDSSFLALREELEPFIEWIDSEGKPLPEAEVPPKLIVYLPIEREKTEYALVEAESAGTVMEPGANPWQRNTRLKVIAERVFKEIAPDQAAEIAKKVDSGRYTLEDLDRIYDQFAEVAVGGVKLVFGTASPTEVALEFATSPEHDETIVSKQALPQLADLFRAGLGIDIGRETMPEPARETLKRKLLASDFVVTLDPQKRPPSISSLASGEPLHLERCQEICRTWRNRSDLRESYSEAACQSEQELRLPAAEFTPNALEASETFPSVELMLLGYAEDLLLAGKTDEAKQLAGNRKNSFWSMAEPICGLRWSVLRSVCHVTEFAKRLQGDLKNKKLAAGAMVKAYADGPEAWCLLDTSYRRMESRFAEFSAEAMEDDEKLLQVIQATRRIYTDAVGALMDAWTAVFVAADFRAEGIREQDRVFSDHVAPLLLKQQGVAYLLVDALRFEMGRELADSLSDEFEAKLYPTLSKLPSVTEVGMAALLPEADNGMELVEEKGGRLAIRIGEEALRNRAARLSYFEHHVGPKVLGLKLGEVSKPAAKRKIRDEKPGLVVVTSQEIDRFGETGEDEDETRTYMDHVMDKLSRAIRRLANSDINHFVIAADHGHIYGESIDSGLKMDGPGGRTIYLGRREWVGQGGNSGEGYIRARASDIGLGGDLELAFPRSLGCFKSKGGSDTYFHGGVSLEEMLIPVIVLRKKEPRPSSDLARVYARMERPRITTRFFSITLTYTSEGLYEPEELSVSLNVTSGKKEAGVAVMAAYGFNEGSREVRLEKDKPNAVTITVREENVKSITVSVCDSASLVELARLPQIPVEIAF